MIRALNFAILPLKLDITEVLVYFSSKTIGIAKKQMITTKIYFQNQENKSTQRSNNSYWNERIFFRFS